LSQAHLKAGVAKASQSWLVKETVYAGIVPADIPHPGKDTDSALASIDAQQSSSRPPRGWLHLTVHGRGGRWLILTAGLIALLFLIPTFSILRSVLEPAGDVWHHLASTVLTTYLLNSLWLVLGVGCGTLLMGVSTAWLVTLCRFPGRKIFEWALVLPMAVPAYVMAYTYTDFLQYSGPVQEILREFTGWTARDYWFPQVRSLGGAIAMLSLVLYPYVYIMARSAFMEQSVCALEVSRTLGCGPWSSFRRVALPLARPAIVGGLALALMETLADFGTVAFFGVQTFTTGVVRAWFSLGDRTAAAQLSAVLLGLVFMVLLLEQTSRGKRRYHQATTRYQELPGYRLKGWRRVAAFTACFLPLFLGFLLPAVILIKMSVEAGDQQFGPRFFELVGNSFTLAGLTALLAVGLALLMAYAVRLAPTAVTRAAARLASLGYAIPGTIIAVGVLIPFARFDNWLDALLTRYFGFGSGLLLTGTLAALVFAYLVRFMAVSMNSVEASLLKVRPSMDDAARSLGEGPLGTLRRIHAPIIRGGLLSAALVVFVDVMKELPATLVMRPFNFDTLAVQAYNLASDERLTEASTSALTIVAVGTLPVILLTRAIARSRPGHNGA
jgi:iron(III) transport system permease protein